LLQLFNGINKSSDMERLFVDGSIVSAHAMGDRGHKDEVIN